MVVVEAEQDEVVVLDPQLGLVSLSPADFQSAWAQMRFLTIVISE
jgi:predicted double-glycine peptidase